MSLFPAYSDVSNSNDPGNSSGPSWVSNSSFNASNIHKKLICNQDSSPSSSESEREESSQHSVTKRKKHKSKKSKKSKDSHALLYYEDSTPIPDEGQRLPQVQLTKPASNCKPPESKNKKEKKKRKKSKDKNRYFNDKEAAKKESELEVVTPGPLSEEEFLRRTEGLNRSLRADPHNTKLWLEYVKLQDLGAGTLRGRAEKKLSILDKALEENHQSDELLHQKMLITESIYPLEKVGREAKALVAKCPQNTVAWLWVLNSSQYNLSKMTAPGVLLTYQHVLEGISRAHCDSQQFLDFLLQCGLFLRQCGLWEQLVLLLELYLELNLTTAGSGAFSVPVHLPEDDIPLEFSKKTQEPVYEEEFGVYEARDQRLLDFNCEVEDRIVTCGLPVGALWLRVERLREGVHFSPVDDSEDPQRVVLREDLTPLLFPLPPSPPPSPRLPFTTLLLLKVPPLPLTHASLHYTTLHKVPSYLDSVELVLAAKFSKGDTSYLEIVPELLLGPQYISNSTGRAEYFQFVNSVFENCITHSGGERVSFLVWQLRWWRWVCSLSSDEPAAPSKKDLLSLGKKLLKRNRDDVPLYTEYALLENQAGDFEAALKVLETTINLKDPPLLTGIRFKRDLSHLYRVYVELLVSKDENIYKEKILATLIALAFGEPVQNITPREELIKKCRERFQHISTEVIRDIRAREVTFSDVLSPDTSVSWLVCHAWFLYITEGVWESVTLLGDAIRHLNASEEMVEGNLLDIIQEGLHEGLLEIFTQYCQNHPGNNSKLFEMAEKALKSYPNNAFFLNTVYSCAVPSLKWSRLLSESLELESPLAAAVLYFMSHVRLSGDDSLRRTAGARLHTLLEQLCARFERCPLFWRLLLQASSLKDQPHIKRTFYLALEKCPWVKVLYYEGAKLLPEDLPEIQDLIVEKELRLHITPEELEILRQGS